MGDPLRTRWDGRTPPGSTCPGNVTHSYKGFVSALEKGAPCAELFDQRSRFTGAEDLAKIDADLARIGCVTRGSARTDR